MANMGKNSIFWNITPCSLMNGEQQSCCFW
jgi:hypothetical protein